jgi:hypothetical protein
MPKRFLKRTSLVLIAGLILNTRVSLAMGVIWDSFGKVASAFERLVSSRQSTARLAATSVFMAWLLYAAMIDDWINSFLSGYDSI